jgi:hypothetical protein
MGLPIKVRWEGWESDTFQLQGCGWEVSVAQDPIHQAMQIALHHRTMKLVGISSMERFNYREIWDRDAYLANVVIPIVHIAPRIDIVTVKEARFINAVRPTNGVGINWDSFKPVDACPSVMMEEIKSLKDLIHFQPLPQAQEIIIPEKSVADLLEDILKKQEPEQMQYWKRFQEEAMLAKGRRLDIEEMPERKVHAQIITFKQRAA